MYYVTLPERSNRVFCKHPDVRTNPAGSNCPLYRMDWERKAEQLAKRSKKR